MKNIKGYLSYSQLKAFAKSPNHWLAYVENKFETTPAMELGTMVHTLVLEPQEFEHRYLVTEKCDKRTNEGKAKYAKYQETLGERTMIDIDLYAKARKIADQVLLHPLAWQLIDGTDAEVVVENPISGELFRTVADGVMPEKYVFDLKTCKDASMDEFSKTAYNLDYHLQAAIYCYHHNVQDYYWIAVETEAPFNVSVYKQSQDALTSATDRMFNLIEQWKVWDGSPQGYQNSIKEIGLPRWAK